MAKFLDEARDPAAGRGPVGELQRQFSDPGAKATTWAQVNELLEQAEIFWLSTVRPGGRPHVTPLLSLWRDERLWFCTGAEERKAANLARNQQVALTTGSSSLHAGTDIVVEGDAEQVEDHPRLRPIADAYACKYDWHFTVRDGTFHHQDGGEALVFVVQPTKIFAYGREGAYSATRWRFGAGP